MQENKNKTTPHIIRRNVKVINTNENSEIVKEITTNVQGDIIKSSNVSKKVENNKNNIKENKIGNKNINTISNNNFNKNNQNKKNNFKRNRTNVIITRNGKSIEEIKKENEKENEVKKEELAKVEEVKANKEVKEIKEEKEVKEVVENKENETSKVKEQATKQEKKVEVKNTDKNINNKNNTQNNRNNKNVRTNQDKGQDTRQDNRKPFNRYNNSDNNNADRPRKDFKNNNNSNNRFNKEGNRNYQNNNQNGQNNKFGNKGGFNRGANKLNQVDKFIKQSSNEMQFDQKETRDYASNLIDKRKYNNNNSSIEGKKKEINKNELREKHTRISTNKLKNMSIDSNTSMLDLYEHDTDSSRKSGNKKKKKEKVVINQTKIIPMTEVKLPEIMTVKELAEKLKKQAAEIIKKLFSLGIMATVNQEIDFDTAFLIAGEFGVTAEKEIVVTDEDILFDESEDNDEDMIPRPPIVVVMGHVDHGKTTLLDRIRSTNVVSSEAGGITQHIGAYKVKVNGKEICFLDTPGHEAFTAMRARGAQITDIAIIIVAADDGIKPQTIEAINHAKAAGVTIIVAINKIDKPGADVERVKRELLEQELVPEEWGGDTICVPISAHTGEGVDTLLEMVILTSEMMDLKANPNKQSKGTVIEAKLDKNIGTVASVIVQRGQLNVGDTIVVGDMIGKIRAMKDDKGKKVKVATPSTPVEIIGLPSVPSTGDVFYEVENEKVAKHLVEKRRAEERIGLIKQSSKVTLDDLFGKIKEGEIKELNLIVKTDVQGTLEALKNSLEKLSNDEVRVRIIHSSTGGIKESDVTLASVSNAIIIGFNVRPETEAAKQADKEKVDMRLYRVIYDAIDDVEAAMKGMLKPKYKENMLGTAEIRQVFKITNVGNICGCYVKEGTVARNAMIRLVRENIIIADVKLESLKREKDDVKEVKEGYECGIKLEKFEDIKVGDILECYELVEEKR